MPPGTGVAESPTVDVSFEIFLTARMVLIPLTRAVIP
jgi:hypothetical protein